MATGGTVGLAKWIIDDKRVLFELCLKNLSYEKYNLLLQHEHVCVYGIANSSNNTICLSC